MISGSYEKWFALFKNSLSLFASELITSEKLMCFLSIILNIATFSPIDNSTRNCVIRDAMGAPHGQLDTRVITKFSFKNHF